MLHSDILTSLRRNGLGVASFSRNLSAFWFLFYVLITIPRNVTPFSATRDSLAVKSCLVSPIENTHPFLLSPHPFLARYLRQCSSIFPPAHSICFVRAYARKFKYLLFVIKFGGMRAENGSSLHKDCVAQREIDRACLSVETAIFSIDSRYFSYYFSSRAALVYSL